MNSRGILGVVLLGASLALPALKVVEWFSIAQAAPLVGGLYLILVSYRSTRAAKTTTETAQTAQTGEATGQDQASAGISPGETTATVTASAGMTPKRQRRFYLCNVLQSDPETRRLWQFGLSGGEVTLAEESAGAWSEPLGQQRVFKDWPDLWRPRLNLAWLPADQVFLRVLHLPASSPAELQSMVELQLEKLSPLPPAQIVWSLEPLPATPDQLQTVIVMIVARKLVDEFLNRLEGQGFLADRLELPFLHQLLALEAEREGLWIYPLQVGDKRLCLIAWWRQGRLQNLNLLQLSAGAEWGTVFTDQLTQIGWAGELEGWFDGQVGCCLIADQDTATEWEPLLAGWSGGPVRVQPPLAATELAALNVRLLAGRQIWSNLIPADFVSRYRQMFIDRLWMRGLAAVVLVYVAGVVVFFLALQVLYFRKNLVDSEIGKISTPYTNSMQLKASVQALQDRLNLKYAALDSYKAAAILLPADLTLTDLIFDKGKSLTIQGLAPEDQVNAIADYNQALSQYRLEGPSGPLLFEKVNPYNSTPRPGPGGTRLVAWSFTCDLKQTEVK